MIPAAHILIDIKAARMTTVTPAASDSGPGCGLRRASIAALGCAALLAACGQGPAPPPAPDAVAAPGLYQIPANAVPDGTLRATVMTRGGAAARGTLSTNGQRFPVALEGLGVAGPAPARVEVVGEAFGLGRTADFAGTYRPVGTGTPGAQLDLTGGLQFGNDNLVVLRLRPAREGQVLTVPAEGIRATLAR
jgi:hypothetical protein